MVDTVRIHLTGKDRMGILNSRSKVILPGGPRAFHGYAFDKYNVEMELPTLLFGHNGRLIENQTELDCAITRFREIIQKYFDVKSIKWTQLDLVWQWKAQAIDIILALQQFYMPGIRKHSSLLHGNELTYGSKNSQRAFKLYDKAFLMKIGSGVLRVEIRLRSTQLTNRININAPLDFINLWKVYRSEVLRFPSVNLPEPCKYTFAELFALLPIEARDKMLLYYRQGRNARTIRNFEREMSEAATRKIGCDLLPKKRTWEK